MNHDQISSATTAELVAFYNAHAAKPVKKFSDRKTAERRVAELIPAVDGATEPAAVRDAVSQAEFKASKKSQRAAEKAAAAALVAERLSNQHCVFCGATADQTGNGPDGTHKGDNELFCHHCGKAYCATTGSARSSMNLNTNASRSAAIAETWKDPQVAALRAARIKVRVDGEDYKSVAQAFRALKLPFQKHIKFRGDLRAAGALDFQHGDRVFHFSLVSEGA